MAVLEQQGGKEAHARAHQPYGCSRDGKHNAGLVGFARIDKTECNLHRQLADKHQLEQNCDNSHDRPLVEYREEYPVLHGTGVQHDVVRYHAVYHDRSHDNGVNNVLKFVFWHFVFSFFVYMKYFLITNRNAAERKKIGRSKLSSTSSYGLLQLPLIIDIIPYFMSVRQD